MKFSNIFLIIIATVLMAWLLPWSFHFITDKPGDYPFTLYSCITRSFAYADRSSGETVHRDHKGNVYTAREFDSILPTFYYRQLMADNRLPSEIGGVPVDARSIQHGSFMFRHTPQNINTIKAPLYFLLESMSGRVDLRMPGDVFRMNSRMEFIDMATNTVNEEKSRLFTEALLAKGFAFPARHIAGNQTVRKDYDEGYLMIDHDYQVFHIKQLKGRPFVRNTGISPSLKMKYAFVTEFRNRRFLGLLTDGANQAHILESKTYELKQLDVSAFNPEKESMSIFGDDFVWTVQIADPQEIRLYAVKSKDYSLADTLVCKAAANPADQVAQLLFPFELSFNSMTDKYVIPRLTNISPWALILNLMLATGFLIRKRRWPSTAWPESVFILLCGIFAFIPLVLLAGKRTGQSET